MKDKYLDKFESYKPPKKKRSVTSKCYDRHCNERCFPKNKPDAKSKNRKLLIKDNFHEKTQNKIQKTLTKLQKKLDEKADWKVVCSILDKKAGETLWKT